MRPKSSMPKGSAGRGVEPLRLPPPPPNGSAPKISLAGATPLVTPARGCSGGGDTATQRDARSSHSFVEYFHGLEVQTMSYKLSLQVVIPNYFYFKKNVQSLKLGQFMAVMHRNDDNEQRFGFR